MNTEPLFTKELLKRFAELGGKKYDKSHQDEVKSEFRPLFDKYGFLKSCLENKGWKLDYKEYYSVAKRNNSTIKDYIWGKAYPLELYDCCKDKAMINVSLQSKESKLLLCIDTDRKKTKDAGIKSNLQRIHENSREYVEQDKLSTLSGDEISDIIIDYYNRHINNFYEFGAEMGIKECINKLTEIKMKEYINLLEKNYNLILTGAPGTGKTYLARQIAAAMIGCETEELTEKNYKDQFGFVQFHPSYDYTDFVEGLRPVHKENSTDIVFERKDGIFMDFCRKALNAYKGAQDQKKEPHKYIFVIDEINRGEISKIFGELFFSIDPGYRGKEGSVSTQYSNLWVEGKTDFDGGEKFYVPENVYVIGTMNDIDRSVESMDFAFRRRFAFREIKAEDRIDEILCDLDNDTEDAKKKMKAINGIIGNSKELGLGQQYKLGPAYFKNIKKYDGKDKWDKLWENHIEGVLREYLRGRPSKDIENEITKMKNEYGKNTGNNGEDDNPEGQPNDTESGTGTTAQ